MHITILTEDLEVINILSTWQEDQVAIMVYGGQVVGGNLLIKV
jgi:hypothetical protein